MRKIVGLVALLVVVWGPWAQAQVAVPELAPGAARIFSTQVPIPPMTGFAPENPAALQWGAPSRVGAGRLEGDKGHLLDGSAKAYDGSLAGFRLVSMGVALAGEVMDAAVDFPDSTAGPGAHLEKRQQAIALSFAWPSWLAFGVGSEQSTSRVVPTSRTGEQSVELDGWVVGVSVKMGEHLYVGGAYSRDELTQSTRPTPEPAHGERLMAGAALRGGGKLIWRLEADVFHRNDFKNDRDQKVLDGYELYLVSADAMLGNWLLGGAAYQSQDVVLDSAQAAALGTATVVNLVGYTIDYGYAPLSGLTFTGRFEHSELTSDKVQISFEEINSLVISWQF